MTKDEAEILVGELSRTSQRANLIKLIATRLHAGASYVQRNVAAAQKTAMIVEEAINNFVFWLTFDQLAPEARPRTDGGRLIFAPRAKVEGLPALGARSLAYEKTQQIDWMLAMRHAIVSNVTATGQRHVNIEKNAALGRILKTLKAAS